LVLAAVVGATKVTVSARADAGNANKTSAAVAKSKFLTAILLGSERVLLLTREPHRPYGVERKLGGWKVHFPRSFD